MGQRRMGGWGGGVLLKRESNNTAAKLLGRRKSEKTIRGCGEKSREVQDEGTRDVKTCL